ncbi:hypothetical protein LWI29_022324 [Acer saccharum]|uniref:Uncharacterized protein n=1 Tax=Acer saccharum TaxID=4024 RepID=A0AA39VEH4_ACESA|nr:hypothetical protein LWI29_022324 [Acer saccharum]
MATFDFVFPENVTGSSLKAILVDAYDRFDEEIRKLKVAVDFVYMQNQQMNTAFGLSVQQLMENMDKLVADLSLFERRMSLQIIQLSEQSERLRIESELRFRSEAEICNLQVAHLQWQIGESRRQMMEETQRLRSEHD